MSGPQPATLVAVERRGRVAALTLQRAPVNAFDGALVDSLEAALRQAFADEAVSVVHIRSGLRVFCAGADLALMQRSFAAPEGPADMLAVVRRMQRLFDEIEQAPVIVVAEISGAALGGGLELALACDLRIAAIEARLGLPEIGLGLLPAAGGTQRLTALCGRGVAARLILGGEVVDGAEAARLGVVQWALPAEQLAGRSRELVDRLAGATRKAVEANKRCIAAALAPGRDGYAEEIAATSELYDDAQTRSLVSAFLAKKVH